MPTVADIDAFWRDVEIGAAIERAYRPTRRPCRSGRTYLAAARANTAAMPATGEHRVAEGANPSMVARLRNEFPHLSFRTERWRCLDGKRVCDVLATAGGAA